MSEIKYDAVIIGAGVAGLFSAFVLSQQGKKVLVIEKQPIPGGYATTFSRKGFVFESSIHSIGALSEGGEIRAFLEENGLASRVEFIELKNFSRIIYPGHDFTVNFSQGDFMRFLKAEFPEEAGNIERFFRHTDRFYAQFKKFTESRLHMLLNAILLPFIYRDLLKELNRPVSELLGRYFKDARLKSVISDIWRFLGLPPSRLSSLYFLIVLESYYFIPTSCVKGGVSRIFEEMEARIKKTGSEFKFNTGIIKILTENKKVRAVLTDKGEEIKTRAVISNANPIDTLTKLLDNHAVARGYDKKLSSLEKSISGVQVYLGLDVPAKNLGMGYQILSVNTTYDHDLSFKYCLAGDYDNCGLEVVDHARIDPSLVPAGKGCLYIMTFDAYSNWKGLSKEEYQRKKQEIGRKLILRSEKYLPGLSRHIEVMEVATPLTMERYSLSPEGAIYGFAQTVKQAGMFRLDQETGIDGLFLAGAWTRPGHGFHGCFVSGLDAAELAIKFMKE